MPDALAGITASSPAFGIHGSLDGAMSALGGMDSEGFLNLLVAQLRFQSPLEPSDPGDLMSQTAALAQLDATQQLIRLEQANLGLQQAVAASQLLGTEVTGIGQDGTPVTGVVEAVRYTALGPALKVDGVEVPFAGVTELRAAAPPPPIEDPPEVWDGPLSATNPADQTT